MGLDVQGDNPWTTLSSRVVWEDRFKRIWEDEALQPNGERSTYTYIEPVADSVGIVAVSSSLSTFLVRQWRYPWKRNSWEIPAGHCEPGEDPLDAAMRELGEEAGLQAAKWTYLGSAFISVAFSRPAHVYLAQAV